MDHSGLSLPTAAGKQVGLHAPQGFDPTAQGNRLYTIVQLVLFGMFDSDVIYLLYEHMNTYSYNTIHLLSVLRLRNQNGLLNIVYITSGIFLPVPIILLIFTKIVLFAQENSLQPNGHAREICHTT